MAVVMHIYRFYASDPGIELDTLWWCAMWCLLYNVLMAARTKIQRFADWFSPTIAFGIGRAENENRQSGRFDHQLHREKQNMKNDHLNHLCKVGSLDFAPIWLHPQHSAHTKKWRENLRTRVRLNWSDLFIYWRYWFCHTKIHICILHQRIVLYPQFTFDSSINFSAHRSSTFDSSLHRLEHKQTDKRIVYWEFAEEIAQRRNDSFDICFGLLGCYITWNRELQMQWNCKCHCSMNVQCSSKW